jgi:two-component system, chemotaxis family, CheB/CheR fusion protein
MRPIKLPDLSGVTLIVVDDNDDSLRVLGEFLRACGAHVLEARGALTALSYVETQDKVHAIVTDLSMPNMDGVELVQRIRTHPRGRAIPAIALTGFYEQYMDTQGTGFNAFLRKPVDFDELCKTIRSVIHAT